MSEVEVRRLILSNFAQSDVVSLCSACVEDGPVTLASNQTQLETHITEVNDDGWPLHQVVVVEENAGSFSIPVEQAQIEIIQDAGAANTDSGYVLSV